MNGSCRSSASTALQEGRSSVLSRSGVTISGNNSATVGSLRAVELVNSARHIFHRSSDGNLSVRAGKEHIIATPTGISKGMMSAADMVVIDSQGNQLYGTRKVSSEIGMHLTIYRMRPDVRAIVHAHPCTATAFASAGIALDQPLCSEAVLTLGAVPLAPYGTPGTPEVSEALKPYIPGHEAILMANHGVVTYGSTTCEAYLRMEAVEHLARIVAVAKQLGQEKYLDKDSVKKLLGARERYNSRCEVALPEAKNVGPETVRFTA
jgi:L-fuculose-phosphate aldolase